MGRFGHIRIIAMAAATVLPVAIALGQSASAQSAGAQSDAITPPDPETLEKIDRRIEATRAKNRALQDKARKLAEELNTLRRDLVTLAQTTQEREALVSSLEEQLDFLEREQEQRRVALKEKHSQLSGTLGALMRLSDDAPKAFFLYPGTPLEAVRGSILLQAAIPELGERASILRADLQALASVQAEIAQKRDRLGQADSALDADRARLKTLIARKKELYEEISAESREAESRLRKLVSESKNLKELIARLNAEKARREAAEEARRKAAEDARKVAEALPNPPASPAPPPAPDVEREGKSAVAAVGHGTSEDAAAGADPSAPDDGRETAVARLSPGSTGVPEDAGRFDLTKPEGLRAFPDAGGVSAPVAGRVVQRYGQDTGFGQTAKGITVETRGGARIVSPYDGQAVFAGPFRDHGHVLIIQHDGGYHSVLAGFDVIDVVPGQWILAGEPIGIMPSDDNGGANGTENRVADAGNAQTGNAETAKPRLYLELRRNGQPVNPLNWITAERLKVHG